MIFDSCTAALSNKSVQRQATIASLRAYAHTSDCLLLDQCALTTLAHRRRQAKLILLYKIIRNISPSYMHSLIPQEVGHDIGYNLRNSNNLRLPKISKNYFLKSFIPSAIRLWNELSDNIRDAPNIESFKRNLNLLHTKCECYKPYLTGITDGHIHLSRIRMKLSGLNFHRMKYHFINFSTCPNCNSHKEDEEHYFLSCNALAAFRDEMITKLYPLLPQHHDNLNNIELKANKKTILKILIYGTKNEDIDNSLFRIVAEYIDNTSRFRK